MPISKVVAAWCWKMNVASFCHWMLGSAIALAILMLVTGYEAREVLAYIMLGLPFSMLFFLPLLMKQQSIVRLRYACDHIPDSLLEMLADAPDIPEQSKARIANILKNGGVVTFGTLFEVENEMRRDEEQGGRDSTPGFRKMLAFANNPAQTTGSDT